MASVLLSASVERCFVSCMRDFFINLYSTFRIWTFPWKAISLIDCNKTFKSISSALCKWFGRFIKLEYKKKNFFLRSDFRQFSNKNVQTWDHFLPLLFPKSTSKVNTQTDGQTDRQTDRRTFRPIESIGTEGRCFENISIWLIGWLSNFRNQTAKTKTLKTKTKTFN